MQSTPTANTLKLTTSTTTERIKTPTLLTTTTTEVEATTIRSPLAINNFGSNTRTTKTIKQSLSKISSTTTTTTTKASSSSLSSSSLATTSTNSIHSSSFVGIDPSKEIEEISKKISEHADAIYRTWKCRGLAPEELLNIYTNAAATAVNIEPHPHNKVTLTSTDKTAADLFAGGNVETTEGLQQFVSQFVIKDKEQQQRGGIPYTASNSYKSQRTETSSSSTSSSSSSLEKTTIAMPENIGNKMTQKSVVGANSTLSGGGGGGSGALKQTTSVSSKKLSTATSAGNSLKSSQSNGESTTSAKKLVKSTRIATATATGLGATTGTGIGIGTSSSSSSKGATLSSTKTNACVKNVNGTSQRSSNVGTKTTTTTTTITSPKRTLEKSSTIAAATSASPSPKTPALATLPTLDINLDLGSLSDLQLVDDVQSLSQLQAQNLLKIKELLHENATEKAPTTQERQRTTTPTSTSTSTPTMMVSKIASKTKRANSPAKLVETLTTTTTTTTDSPIVGKTKTNKIINNQQHQQEQIGNINSNDVFVPVGVKKIAKNLNTNKNNSKGVSTGSGSKLNKANNCLVETNNFVDLHPSGDNDDVHFGDDDAINRLINTQDNKGTTLRSKSNTTTTTTKGGTTTKSTSVKSPTISASSVPTISIATTTKPTTTATPTPTATTTTTTTTVTPTSTSTPTLNVVGTRNKTVEHHQSIKAIGSNSNSSVSTDSGGSGGSVSNQLKSTKQEHVASSTSLEIIPTIQKSTIKSTTKINKTINNSNIESIKQSEKITGNCNSRNNNISSVDLKLSSPGMEIARQSSNERNNLSSSTTSTTNTTSVTTNGSSNMPAPTKFKTTRAASATGNVQDKNLARPFLTRGSVAERVLMFEKCPDVRNSFLNIKRPDPADAPPKSLLKAKLHATPPPPPEQNSLQREIRSLKSVYIPRFYFPHGKPQPQIAQERTLRGILSAFDSFPNNQVTKDELPRILKLCGLPFYWRMPVMVFCQQGNCGLVERQRFVEFWKQMNVYCHEDASRFVYILSRGQRFRSYILPEDLVPLVQDVVDTHPGLAFLKEATEFHSRYVHTVIARIFYSVNRSWSGKITISELKKSDLLEIITLLEEEDDINQIMAFFSYEHFYVIYCKFWELDKDHDLLINQDDLARHSDHALSTRIVERIFSGCVTRNDNKKSPEDEAKMSYTDFVWFLLSEEDKRTPTAIEYWFRCMDLDGDGMLSMYELEYFYEEQQQRMESIGIETLPFEDCLCQMLDMIKPQRRDAITLGDLKRCKMTHVFFDTFFNLEKYLDHEQRDPFASQRDEYVSDWDRFAAQEYELLITEEND